MELEYHSPAAARKRDGEGLVYLILLRVLVAYFAVCTITVPFMDAWWLFGEVPVLALVQVPKVEAADEVQHFLVMKFFPATGLSLGSYSPDSTRARPWALAAVYLVVIGLMLGVVWFRRGMRPPWRRWAIVVVAMGVIDCMMTLWFAGGPGFTIY